ncbi:MAG: 30S ribosomal protein S12 methylthiotransferase RimO [Pseudomonadales bacterium]|jgi:ribosomal protein S12 methylthiotransferase|nr:30S ribosomal protein S12 methylthiotransferase RimO [Pseudomonadales bacterium]MDP6473108.1 30S ribosomal protein S12 methylthiotransferase RimO [Pseudomonadales bacterium]MDP6826135.1 30S ribosomal protein S12 methylthiotransferase RimO [Pseudomonadales bacterium]MDP6971848.1 30S ribosomal protein S12 methylthiotransferase RimO [Pseudomonadales bacterium]|tara:strand:+ start:222 stop:1550 length:1329 start_codon:yes stop_codon:yes gene_type:complete
MTRVSLVSLGCPKALVDSQDIVTNLARNGFEIAQSAGVNDTDVVVINTCGFIDAARDESYDAIEDALAVHEHVIVTGCLGSQAEELSRRYPRLTAVTGPQATAEVVDAVTGVAQPSGNVEYLMGPEGVRLTPAHYAYLKISEGCNHGCSFCIIPSLRGALRSRPIDAVLREAERLVDTGVQELLVIAQDTSAYGVDLRYEARSWRGRELRSDIVTLAEALGEMAPWVRLHYVYPYPHVDRLIPLMAERRILPYIDMPLQHASPGILRAMRRPAASEAALARIQAWRGLCADLTIRSTFVVGFPGETDADFEMLLSFLVEAELDRVGCFTYSNVAGAAANRLEGHVEERVKLDRQEMLLEVQAAISARRLRERIGSVVEVLVDEVDERRALARSAADALDIDGIVEIKDAAGLSPGDITLVRITGATDHDLVADNVGRSLDVR